MTASKGVGRGGHNKTRINLDQLQNQYLQRRPVIEIAAEYGVTIQTVYRHLKKLGVTRSNAEAHLGQPAWNKGRGRRLDSAGYARVWKDGKQVREHRLVAEHMLGRKLHPGEVVHHKNGNKADNRPENLEIHASHSEHMKEHMTPEEARRRGRRGGRTRRAALAALAAVGVDVSSI